MIHYLDTVGSTNTYLGELVKHTSLDEFTTVVSFHQTAGRGQTGNKWEINPNENIALSILLRPEMDVHAQFGLSMATSLAVVDVLLSCGVDKVGVKWPNDVYIGTRKVCGMLLEGALSGHRLDTCVVGVGLNVNQSSFPSSLPNAVSLKMVTGRDYDLRALTERLVSMIQRHYVTLLNEGAGALKPRYMSLLVNGGGVPHWFVDNATCERFQGVIADVEQDGKLVLRLADGQCRSYYFKEVAQVIGGEDRE